MTVFALVHGAWHGGWCWDRVVQELEARGHRAIAPDLPCDVPAADADAYADAVVRALADVDEPVVVVGHSQGGITIPLVAARRPVERLVFLAALVPQPGRTLGEVLQLAGHPGFDPGFSAGQETTDTGGSRWRPEAAVEFFYDDLPPDEALLAAEHLRVQHWGPAVSPFPPDAWPDVPSTYIVCADDRAVDPDTQRRLARDVLGVEPIEVPGGHSPFLTRPAELAALLVEAAG